MKKLLSIFIAILLTVAALSARTIVIDTPYLIGEEVRISATQTGVVRAICVDDKTIFYHVESKGGRFDIFTLKQLQEQEQNKPSIEIETVTVYKML